MGSLESTCAFSPSPLFTEEELNPRVGSSLAEVTVSVNQQIGMVHLLYVKDTAVNMDRSGLCFYGHYSGGGTDTETFLLSYFYLFPVIQGRKYSPPPSNSKRPRLDLNPYLCAL